MILSKIGSGVQSKLTCDDQAIQKTRLVSLFVLDSPRNGVEKVKFQQIWCKKVLKKVYKFENRFIFKNILKVSVVLADQIYSKTIHSILSYLKSVLSFLLKIIFIDTNNLQFSIVNSLDLNFSSSACNNPVVVFSIFRSKLILYKIYHLNLTYQRLFPNLLNGLTTQCLVRGGREEILAYFTSFPTSVIRQSYIYEDSHLVLRFLLFIFIEKKYHQQIRHHACYERTLREQLWFSNDASVSYYYIFYLSF